MNSKQNIHFISVIILFIITGCKKFVAVDVPKTQLVTASVFANNSTANSAQLAIYSSMLANASPYFIPLSTGLSSDELKTYSSSQDLLTLYSNTLNSLNPSLQSFWANSYNYIYQANAVLEGLQDSKTVSENVKQQLLGESKFIRAFWHFYLINLYGEVPLITSTDFHINGLASRSSQTQIYQQIIDDLKDAQNLLNQNYVSFDGITTTTDRVRPNKSTATALLARVYLYNGDWVNAEAQASSVISNVSLYDTVSINNVFLKNNKEAIWQLQPVVSTYNTVEGNRFALTGAPGTGLNNSSVLSDQLLNSFESGDKRKSNWTNSVNSSTNTFYYPFKYKVATSSGNPTEYSTVLRLGEVYLIRAEARAKQNNLSAALVDLNIIRSRAGLGSLSSSLTQTQILLAVEQERRVELFTEWGHRWLDLKRTNRTDMILGPIKGNNWQTTDQLYPIPQTERNNDPNLSQNQGY